MLFMLHLGLSPTARARRLALTCAALLVPLGGVTRAGPPGHGACRAPDAREGCDGRHRGACPPAREPAPPPTPEYGERPSAEACEPDDLRRSMSDAELRELGPPPLRGTWVPEPWNLRLFIRDREAAIALGKAFFWEQRVGSQGQACASCHFQAGADPRAKHQLSPGLRADDPTFQPTGSGGAGGPNYRLKPDDFPFHRKVDPRKSDERDGNTLFDTNDVTSSQGVALARFLGVVWNPLTCTYEALEDDREEDPVFKVGGVKVRRVEPRNTPTVINAVFNHRSFWDGRANFDFNGLDPFGRRSNEANPDQGVYVTSGRGCRLAKVQVALPFSSLASQAVGPPTNDFEMSAAGKTFPYMARLLLRHYPLSLQEVHPGDSALSRYTRPDGKGLWLRYEHLLRRAVHPRWWAYRGPVALDGDCFRQMDANFALIFGLCVQLYESTLVSTGSRYEAFAAGHDRALTHEEKFGMEVFVNQGRCINCHSGPTFSGAAVPVRLQELVERMEMARGVAVYDGGFYNIGVRPTTDDLGVGGTDPFGSPLSFSQQLSDGRLVDRFRVHPERFEVDPGEPVQRGERTAVRGAFKTPTLLNVELTAPYMHNGGMHTLEQVVEFYARGGDFHRANIRDLDPDIRRIDKINGKPRRIRAVAAFLRALTDPRVVDERGPFDHPSLLVHEGNVGDEVACTSEQEQFEVPAVGRCGRERDGLPPIRTFLQEDEQ